MDFGAIGENLSLIVALIVLMLWWFFRRKGRVDRTRPEVVQSLLTEVRLNLALVETFNLRQKPKKFEVVSWQRNKTKLDFLAQSLQVVLSDAFGMIEDFNQQIEAAKKYKSASYMVNINIDKLKKPLMKSREGLEEWLLANIGTKEPSPKSPGLFDFWFGGR